MKSKNYLKLTMANVDEIRSIQNEAKNIGDWKRLLKEKAVKFGLSDREAIDICNDRI